MSRIVFAVACAVAMFLVFIGMAVKESCKIGQCGGLEDEEEKEEDGEDAEEDAP